MSGVDIKRGLKDVYFATSEASFIDGSIGKLLYRGYNIDDIEAPPPYTGPGGR